MELRLGRRGCWKQEDDWYDSTARFLSRIFFPFLFFLGGGCKGSRLRDLSCLKPKGSCIHPWIFYQPEWHWWWWSPFFLNHCYVGLYGLRGKEILLVFIYVSFLSHLSPLLFLPSRICSKEKKTKENREGRILSRIILNFEFCLSFVLFTTLDKISHLRFCRLPLSRT